MDVIEERPAALDVHDATVMACVRLPGPDRTRVEHVAEFRTTAQKLLALALSGYVPEESELPRSRLLLRIRWSGIRGLA
jgi:hypothetical protein